MNDINDMNPKPEAGRIQESNTPNQTIAEAYESMPDDLLSDNDYSAFAIILQQSEQLLEDISLAQTKTKDYIERQVQGESIPQEVIEENLENLRQSRSKLSLATFRIFNLEDEISHVTKELQSREQKRRWLPKAPANAYVDWLEEDQLGFARGLNRYKRFLVFFLGCFVGVVVEMIWCYFRNGYVESRAGLVYGPFNPLYGAGALLLTQALYSLRNRSPVLIFLVGAVVTSIVEYISSWGLEFVYGMRSWDYSNLPLNINGRITLLYSIFWGLLSVLWIKDLYPRLSMTLVNIPERAGRYVTHLLAGFMVLNIVVTGLALARWVQRDHNQHPVSRIFKVLDKHFPDERMERIFPNMVSADDET